MRYAIITALVITPHLALAQHGAAGLGAPPREAAQFDFLVGQWDLTVTPKVSGLAARIHGAPKLTGTWKAWRAFDGFGIEDEMRIVDGSGNPASLSHTMRVFNATDKRWSNTSLDVYRSRFSSSTADWRNNEMHTTGTGVDAEGKAYMTRSRFSAISKDRFTFQQDRSTDNGKTWNEAVLRIEAKRIATSAPR
jgi:hypothetical protein